MQWTRLTRTFLVLTSLTISAPLSAQATARTFSTAIAHVTVIDVVSGRRIPDQTVLIAGNRIVSVNPATKPLSKSAHIIDGRGKFLIPGLWDMHVHLFGNVLRVGTDKHDIYFPLLLANGVTGVRDMWTDLEDLRVLHGWQSEAAKGQMLMPRVVPTSTPVDGSPGLYATSVRTTTPEAARHFVDSMYAGGARTIKMLEPGRDVYFAAMEEAKKLGIPVVGHVPPAVTALEASAAGQRSMEHMLGVLEGCSRGEAELAHIVTLGTRQPTMRQQIMLDTYSDSLCDALFSSFVKHQTWQVPTAGIRISRLMAFDPEQLNDPAMRYVQSYERDEWQTAQQTAARATDSATAALRRRFAEHVRAVLGRMQHDGVRIMAGSDIGNPFIIAGFSIHKELAIMVQSGFTPLEALRTATINPAEFLGAADTLGTVAKGKRADLVLLDADPLADIHNVSRIRTVIANGRVLDRAALDRLLEGAHRTAIATQK
jgi:imidazolonepropionase-like amidohydrolase